MQVRLAWGMGVSEWECHSVLLFLIPIREGYLIYIRKHSETVDYDKYRGFGLDFLNFRFTEI
jgi:hypothetical protein